MIIWLASYPRSGNSMLRMLVHQVFGVPTTNKHASRNNLGPLQRDQRISEAFGQKPMVASWPDTYRNLADSSEVHFVKTHDAPEDQGKAIYLVRNGFSSVLSYKAFLRDFSQQECSFEDVIMGMPHFASWGRHLDQWNPMDRPNTLLVKYENLRDKPEIEIERIAEFCGLRPQGQWVNEFDKFHAIQPNFFRKGESKDVSNEFPETARELFLALHGDWMVKLGYCDRVAPVSQGHSTLRRLVVDRFTALGASAVKAGSESTKAVEENKSHQPSSRTTHPHDFSNRLIFCISSGRSGSEYLQHLLGTAQNVSAFHEPQPDMSGEFLKVAMEQSLAANRAQRMVKVEAIKQHFADKPANHIYVETNHMFIKTFSDVVMDAFPHSAISVVILRRDLVKVLKSFINLGYFSGWEGAWPGWMHRVPSGISAICPPMPYDQMDVYDKIISYLIDIEAQAQAFKQKFPDCTVHEARLEQLQDEASVAQFFKALRLEPTSATAAATGVKVNERPANKAVANISTTEEICRERILKYLQLCAEKGIALPKLPQFAG